MSKAAKPGDKGTDAKGKDDPKNDPKGQNKGGDGKDAKGKNQPDPKDAKGKDAGKDAGKEMKSPKIDHKGSPRGTSEDHKPEKNIIHKIFIEAPPPEKEDRKAALENSGILDAYAHLLQEFCKYGLPKGNVFEFAAVSILKFERKQKAEKANKLHAQTAVEGIEKYKELYRHRSVEAGAKGSDRDRSDSPQRNRKDRSESPQRAAGKKDRERSPSPEKGKDGKDAKGKDAKGGDKKDDKKDAKGGKDDKNAKPDDKGKGAKPDDKKDAKGAKPDDKKDAKPDPKAKDAKPPAEEKKDDKKKK